MICWYLGSSSTSARNMKNDRSRMTRCTRSRPVSTKPCQAPSGKTSSLFTQSTCSVNGPGISSSQLGGIHQPLPAERAQGRQVGGWGGAKNHAAQAASRCREVHAPVTGEAAHRPHAGPLGPADKRMVIEGDL